MLLSPVVVKWEVKAVGTHQTTNGTARANAQGHECPGRKAAQASEPLNKALVLQTPIMESGYPWVFAEWAV
jgi:hypothetical protein